MPTAAEPLWMTQAALKRLEAELASLAAPGREQSEQDQARALELRELIRRAEVSAKPDDGLVEPGMIVTIRFDADGSEETFLLGSREVVGAVDLEVEVSSPTAPLGQAIVGRVVGEATSFTAPSGASIAVTIVRATPFG